MTKDLGRLGGPVLLFGGIYSNLAALEALMKVADQLHISPSNIINTGDIVAYCAHPNRCIDTVKEWGIHSILGNVELNLIEGVEDCGCNFEEGSRCDVFSREWYPFAKESIQEQHTAFLSTLPDTIHFSIGSKRCHVLHGSTQHVSEFIFESTDQRYKQKMIEASEVDIIIGGHAGIPFIETYGKLAWVNPGVIGMPANDGTTDTWYAILDEVHDIYTVQFHRLAYDHEKAAMDMHTRQLLPSYAQTLRTGIWDNMDILPELEKAQQGKAIGLDQKTFAL